MMSRSRSLSSRASPRAREPKGGELAIRAADEGVAPRARAEEDDAARMRGVHEAADGFAQFLRGHRPHRLCGSGDHAKSQVRMSNDELILTFECFVGWQSKLPANPAILAFPGGQRPTNK